MAPQDRVRWDAIYKDRSRQPYPSPDPLLLQWTPPVPPDEQRLALDLAAGYGQNGLWLASQGYTVDVMDISRVALSRARGEMAMRNIRNVNLLQTDLDDIDFEDDHYDLVCIFRYLKRDSLRHIRASIATGGRIIYETFNLRYLEVVPEFNVDFLVLGGELSAAFEDWHILCDREDGHISQLVAVRPG